MTNNNNNQCQYRTTVGDMLINDLANINIVSVCIIIVAVYKVLINTPSSAAHVHIKF